MYYLKEIVDIQIQEKQLDNINNFVNTYANHIKSNGDQLRQQFVNVSKTINKRIFIYIIYKPNYKKYFRLLTFLTFIILLIIYIKLFRYYIYICYMTLENDPRYKLYIGNHKEETRKYSSIWGNDTIGNGHARSMINSSQAWSAKYNRKGQWIEIDMGHEKQIGGVVIQPRKRSYWRQYVKYVDVFTKKDGERNWTKQLSNAKANTQPNQTTKIYFNNISICRYVRISVLDWNDHISMRSDVLIADHRGIMLNGIHIQETQLNNINNFVNTYNSNHIKSKGVQLRQQVVNVSNTINKKNLHLYNINQIRKIILYKRNLIFLTFLTFIILLIIYIKLFR